MEEQLEKDSLSVGNFIGTFIAILKAKGIELFDRNDLESIIYEYKNDPRFKRILDNIKFRSNGIHYYSNQLEEIFSAFHFLGIISTNGLDLSDSRAKIEDSPIKIMIKNNIDYFEEIIQFVDVYFYELSRIEMKKQSEAYERYANLEETSCLMAAENIRNMGSKEETEEKYQKLFRSLE